MAKTYSRTVKVFIDGKEVEGTVPIIQKKIRELTREIKQMAIGTEEYNKKVKEIAQLNTIDDRFSAPIVAETYATGKHGTMEAERLVNKMKSNVSRKKR